MNQTTLYDEKYASFLATQCLPTNRKRPIVILYKSKALKPFATLIMKKAKRMGFQSIFLFNNSEYEKKEYLNQTKLKDIKQESYFDLSHLEYCAKNSGFQLQIETFEESYPKKIDPAKEEKASYLCEKQLNLYFEYTSNLKCPGTVAIYPTRTWAKKLFPELPVEEAFIKLYQQIMEMCLLETKDPLKAWNQLKENHRQTIKKLNQLKMKKLHYQNHLGTNLTISLPENHLWLGSFEKDYFGNDFIYNVPSYEAFTSPIYYQTEGTVFSTKPLVFHRHNNYIVDHFGLEFQHGAVKKILVDKDEDYQVIKDFLNTDTHARYLGECALVEQDTPVSKTNTLYYHALLDENASCHLALGFGFPDTIPGGIEMDKRSLLDHGINTSSTHLDFMIGSDDLEIIADTNKGKQLIYQNGKIKL